MTTPTSTDNSNTEDETPPNLGIFSEKYTITSIDSDPQRWNKDWEKILNTLPFAEVYATFSHLLRENALEDGSEIAGDLEIRSMHLQKTAVELWNPLEEKGHFRTAWPLLEEKERKRHLMKGIWEATMRSSLGQDTRALCPEITTSLMLKGKGKGFMEFIHEYHQSLKNTAPGTPYTLPSEWWGVGGDASTSAPPEEEKLFALLTIQRNEFITLFAVGTGMSILNDFAHGSPGMNPVMDMMQSEPIFATAWSKTVSSTLSKPIMRCENCAKSPEMIGGDPKFMVCSICKSKLSFVVHYCSQACQKKDWPTHKKHCGKQKVSKKLRGTVNDPFWEHPEVPDHLRSIPVDADGNVSMSSIGFGTPDPSRPYSPALQRQVSLLRGDKDADYFLFDEVERPVRFALPDGPHKMAFRIMRSDALSKCEQKGVQVIFEYLLNVMGSRPGLNRDTILAQAGREYGQDSVRTIVDFEKLAVKNGFEPGTTFLEKMGNNLRTTLPRMMGQRSQR